jgi:predicted GH43/DUF377 family glycosyl hydrolase/DNA-binding MarR family transcriptional regulator
MILRGRKPSKEKKHGQIIRFLAVWIVWLFVLFELLILSQATAAPVIINDENGGFWFDYFLDEEGIETHSNTTLKNGIVTLLPLDEEKNWIKQGVAVENRDVYDFFFAKNPNVMNDNGMYKMWYAGWNGNKVRILYATSTDCVNWEKSQYNPVIDVGLPGAPDDTHVDVPKVIKENGMYKMWYSGNDSTDDRLMYATSFDGINWTKHGVVLPDLGVRPNTVMKDGSIYKMYYQILDGGHWRIYYATSNDGISWTKQGLVLDISDPGELDDMHVSGASVIKESNSVYKMWYSGHHVNERYRIFYATSLNGIEWTKQGLAIDLGDQGDKDENGTAYPNVIKDVDGHYKIWYSATVNGYDMSIMHAVSYSSINENGIIISIKISLPPNQSWNKLVIDKLEAGADNHLFVTILDGTTDKPISGFKDLKETNFDISSIDNIAHPSIKLQATFIGDGISTPVLIEWGVTWLNPQASPIAAPSTMTLDGPWAVAIIAATTGTILVSLTFAGATEVGRYRLIPFIFPLYSRLKKEEVLDQFTRGRIYEYIRNNPGDHYNSIKQELNLNNGVLSYHLRTLEREQYLKSTRDGMYKRFYPVDVKVPRVNGFGVRSIQGQMIMHIISHPGLTQKEISAAMSTSQQVVSYHLKLMMVTGHIRAERQGKTNRYYVNEKIPRSTL